MAVSNFSWVRKVKEGKRRAFTFTSMDLLGRKRDESSTRYEHRAARNLSSIIFAAFVYQVSDIFSLSFSLSFPSLYVEYVLRETCINLLMHEGRVCKSY